MGRSDLFGQKISLFGNQIVELFDCEDLVIVKLLRQRQIVHHNYYRLTIDRFSIIIHQYIRYTDDDRIKRKDLFGQLPKPKPNNGLIIGNKPKQLKKSNKRRLL